MGSSRNRYQWWSLREEIREAEEGINMESLIADAMERVRVKRAFSGRMQDGQG